jgi:NitT/TauT family transport system permease protein
MTAQALLRVDAEASSVDFKALRFAFGVWAVRLAIAAALIALWHFAVASNWVDEFFVPAPRKVLDFIVGYVTSGNLLHHGSVTLQETILGFAAGALLGIAVGLFVGWSRFWHAVLGPYMTFFNALPRVALAPMFILWFGIGIESKILLAFSLVFFIVVIATEAGVRSVDTDLSMMARVMGASEWQRFLKVIMPGAVPSIFAGLRIGVIYALLGVVVGEMIASKQGLGQQIMEYSYGYQPAGVFGVLFNLALIALALNALMSLLEKRLMRWKGDE